MTIVGGYFVGLLPDHLHRAADRLVHVLMAAVAIAMIWYGLSLTLTTWFQAYPEFAYVRVGVVYSGIPGSGIVLLAWTVPALVAMGLGNGHRKHGCSKGAMEDWILFVSQYGTGHIGYFFMKVVYDQL